MNRIESDRMNRTDWIESETTKNWKDSDLSRIVLPMLGGNKILRLKLLKSEYKSNKEIGVT